MVSSGGGEGALMSCLTGAAMLRPSQSSACGALGPGLSEDPAFREKLEMQGVNIEFPDLENHQVWFPGRRFCLLI